MGDDTKETKKKSKKKPKSQKKKTWSREEILNTFLPPEKQQALQKSKQQALQKSKQHRSKTVPSEPEKKSDKKPEKKSAKKPAKKPAKRPAKKEKKPVPQVVIKEKKEAESPAEAGGEAIVVCVTSSQELDHSIHDAVGPHGSQTEVGGESSWMRELIS